MSYRLATIRWDDLDGAERYSKARAYAQSKLANLLFAFELQHRLERVGAGTISVAAHPGMAATEIAKPVVDRFPRAGERLVRAGARVLPPAAAALPSLRAATAPDVRGGEFYGPGGVGGVRGAPVATGIAGRALDSDAMRRLWALSVELTGVEYPLP